MSQISAGELNDRLMSGEAPLVLDIRHEDEFQEWHIPGSENIPVYDALKSDSASAAEALDTLPTDPEIVTVCAVGGVSQTATDTLQDLGYDAKTLVDGMAGWSRVHRHAPIEVPIDGTLIQIARPGKGCLSHLLVSNGEAVVFDPSQYTDEYTELLEAYDARLVGVFDTHAHADHVSGGRDLAMERAVPYYLHPADATGVPAEPVADGQTITVGNVEISVLHSPGHSPGGVTYRVDDAALLTGDTLFHSSVGRVELGTEAGVDDTPVREAAAALYESLQRLRAVDGDPLVLPAHDPGSPDPPVVARLSEVEAQNEDFTRDREEFIDRLVSDLPEHPPNFQRIKGVNVGTESVSRAEAAELEAGPNRCAAE
jgi:glyoxylase-like metal-dependent hydrolase (beta-lactamase superfamily II)